MYILESHAHTYCKSIDMHFQQKSQITLSLLMWQELYTTYLHINYESYNTCLKYILIIYECI